MTSYVREIHMQGKDKLTTQQKKDAKEKLDKVYKEESKLVNGTFKNLECPGGEIEFQFKAFPQDPIRVYTLADGGTYDLPLCVAKHINNTCNIKQHERVVDALGNQTIDMNKGEQRYQFLSSDFS